MLARSQTGTERSAGTLERLEPLEHTRSRLNDLNDWNGAQRWNPSTNAGQAIGTGRNIK
jgi:hypothetical protein